MRIYKIVIYYEVVPLHSGTKVTNYPNSYCHLYVILLGMYFVSSQTAKRKARFDFIIGFLIP